MTEQELILKLQEGDQRAFRDLVERFQAKVSGTAYSFVLNTDDADDIAQEVFIEVYRSIAGFKGDSGLSTWLYRITVNKSLDHLRKKKRKRRIQQIVSIFDREGNTKDYLAPNPENPEHILEQDEKVKILHEAVSRLPEKQKIAFSLNKFDLMSNKEIAEIMQIGIATVDTLIFRARKELKSSLQNYYYDKI